MISEFLSKISQEGIAKPTLYTVEFVKTPAAMTNQFNNILKDMRIFVETAEFPGTQILTQDSRIYDMSYKVAYGKAVDDFNMTIRLDRNFKLKRFFDEWVNAVYNKANGNIRYKNDYSGTIKITQLDEFGNATYGVILEEAFPIQIQPLSLGFDQQNTYHKLPVTFTYKKWVFSLSESFLTPKVAPKPNSLDQIQNQVKGLVASNVDPIVNKIKDQQKQIEIVRNIPGSIVDRLKSSFTF